jgi:hypothetical protein
MKKIILLVTALVFLGFILLAHEYPVEKKEEIQKTLKFADPAKAKEVLVDNIFGSIRVQGYSGNEVLLVAHKTIKARNQDKLQKALEEVKLDLTEKGNTVDIFVDGPFRCHDRRGHSEWRDPGYEVQYDFELRVPFQTNLDISTVNQGDIEVGKVEGEFEVSNVNGKIRMSDVAGSGEAQTVNGEVQVIFARSPGGNCEFKTVNGEVDLSFPGDLSADFRMKTFNGEIYSDFPVTHLTAAPAKKEQEKGKFVYKSDRFFGVRTGKGGPEIKLDTLNGDIYIRKRTA